MRNIALDNFRGFKQQKFKFSKVNILIGENSSGKSSFLKFILALKQTAFNKNINLKLFGDYADLGNYEETIYNNDVERKLSFSFEYNKEYANYYRQVLLQFNEKLDEAVKQNLITQLNETIKDCVVHPTKIQYVLDKNLSKHDSIKITFSNKAIGELEIEHLDNSNIILGNNPKCNLIFHDINGNKYLLEDIDYLPEAFASKIISSNLKRECDKIFEDNDVTFFKIAYLLITQNFLEFNLEKVNFSNPLHSSPARFFYSRDISKNQYKNINIETLVSFFSDDSKSAEEKKRMMLGINEAVLFFGLADEIKIEHDNNMSVFQVKVKIKDLWSNITDVGYGVSLQIPIILQAILSEINEGEIILIEQPETHLHPKLQANFIDTLLKIGKRNTYFIETHSEYIVRKLQSIIKSKAHDITHEDITIHYFKRGNNGFEISEHLIDEFGKLTPNIPSGFFDSSYLLAKELL